MKQEFSSLWNASVQPRKQRKYLANAPFSIRHRILSANLSKELRKKYGKRSFPLRKNDEVKVMRGEFKKKTGKITVVDLKNYRVSVEGIQRTKKDGTKINIYLHPSNLQIKELNLDDKKRKEALERKKVNPKPKDLNESKVAKKTESNIKKETSPEHSKKIKPEKKLKETNKNASKKK